MPRAHRLVLAVSLAISPACAPRGGRSHVAAPAPPAPDVDDITSIPDVEDRCPALPPSCLDGFDTEDSDGCPDPDAPAIRFAPGGDAPLAADAIVLDQVAIDARQLVPGARLVLVGDAAPGEAIGLATRRAETIAQALRDRGVPADRLAPAPAPAAGPGTPQVVIRVEGCDATAARSPAPRRDGFACVDAGSRPPGA